MLRTVCDGGFVPAVQHKIRVGAPELEKLPQRDPLLVATAYKKQRLYLFSRREPADAEDAAVSVRVRVCVCGTRRVHEAWEAPGETAVRGGNVPGPGASQ